MLIVEIHSNNILTVRDGTFACAISDSKKHETVKFLFPESWEKYCKTAVFSAENVPPINILLDSENQLCLSENECYIPFEVLKGDWFELSIFGERDNSLATTPRVRVDVVESGYALGDAPQTPTPDQYSQILSIMDTTKSVAQSVRDDADAGLFKGEKGDIGPQGLQGEKGDKGDDYVLTETDKKEIADMIDVSDTDLSGAAPSITNTISGGEKTLTVNDVSPIAHKCSLRLTSDGNVSRNIYNFNSDNVDIETIHEDDNITCTYMENGTVVVDGVIVKNSCAKLTVTIFSNNLIIDETYTFSIRDTNKNLLSSSEVVVAYEDGTVERSSDSSTSHTFTPINGEYAYSFIYSLNGEETEDPYFNYFENETLYPQLELGETATEWQKYGGNAYIEDFSTIKVDVNGSEYTPNVDGTVTDIESKSPIMEITTNNEHVNICDFTYCVDTKRYIDSVATKEDFIIIVNTLPETGITNRLYLVPRVGAENDNLFDEFLWINGEWEFIGSKQVEVDLSQYIKNTDYATRDKAGVVKIGGGNETGITINNGELTLNGTTDYVITHPKSYNVALTSKDIYKWFRTGMTTNDIALTEEEKAAACEWIGAATKGCADKAVGAYELIEEITLTEASNVDKTTTPNGTYYKDLYKNMLVTIYNAEDKACSFCYMYRGDDLCMFNSNLNANEFGVCKTEIIAPNLAEWSFSKLATTHYGTNLQSGCVVTSNNVSRVHVNGCTAGTVIKIYGEKA